jgi:hypothetical protein
MIELCPSSSVVIEMLVVRRNLTLGTGDAGRIDYQGMRLGFIG